MAYTGLLQFGNSEGLPFIEKIPNFGSCHFKPLMSRQLLDTARPSCLWLGGKARCKCPRTDSERLERSRPDVVEKVGSIPGRCALFAVVADPGHPLFYPSAKRGCPTRSTRLGPDRRLLPSISKPIFLALVKRTVLAGAPPRLRYKPIHAHILAGRAAPNRTSLRPRFEPNRGIHR